MVGLGECRRLCLTGRAPHFVYGVAEGLVSFQGGRVCGWLFVYFRCNKISYLLCFCLLGYVLFAPIRPVARVRVGCVVICFQAVVPKV